MLSVVVVGRNDSHGYNLNKRVITSLNSIASLLTLDDELIFVDWNTPLTLPAMPVSIYHDLTEHCKSVLKVVRVPEKVHEFVKGSSNKPLLEPIARNVGIRRSNPRNKWVLSTNTDMIFLAENFVFKDILGNLDENLWTSYRFELPEFLWESLDGRNPEKTHKNVKRWHSELDLPRRYYSNLTGFPGQKIVDAVGDFQLAPRHMWFSIKGFPEEMLKGWHVDSRASVAFENLCGKPSSIFQEDNLITYHQNHLRTLTGYHAGEGNDPALALEKYENKEVWGLADFDLTKVQIENLIYTEHVLLHEEIRNFEKNNLEISLNEVQKSKSYELSHVALYLVDIFVTMPENQKVLVISMNKSLENLIRKFSTVFRYELTAESFETLVNFNKYDLIIIDFGIESKSVFSISGFQIIEFLKFFLYKKGKQETTFVFLRSQNWGIRTLINHFYNVPLFNNYTQILVGRQKSNIDLSARSRIKLKLALAGVATDYKVKTNSNIKDGNSTVQNGSLFNIAWQIYKKMPDWLRVRFRKLIISTLKF